MLIGWWQFAPFPSFHKVCFIGNQVHRILIYPIDDILLIVNHQHISIFENRRHDNTVETHELTLIVHTACDKRKDMVVIDNLIDLESIFRLHFPQPVKVAFAFPVGSHQTIENTVGIFRKRSPAFIPFRHPAAFRKPGLERISRIPFQRKVLGIAFVNPYTQFLRTAVPRVIKDLTVGAIQVKNKNATFGQFPLWPEMLPAATVSKVSIIKNLVLILFFIFTFLMLFFSLL